MASNEKAERVEPSCDACGTPRRRLRSREALRSIRRAWCECREGALQEAYVDARWRTRGLRLGLALVDHVLPMTEAIAFAGEMDCEIRASGLAEASAAGIQRLGLNCEPVMSDEARQALETSPVIVYGNHPTILTPFLISSAAHRSDVRLFMVDAVRHLLPSLGKYLLPLELPAERDSTEWHRGRIVRLASRRLGRLVMENRDRAEARQANQLALADGVRHLEQGGCVVIFPGGGGRDERRWYPGIGQVARELRARPSVPEVFLLPVHEDARSEAHVYRGLRRLGDEGRSPKPVRLRFAEPRRLVDLVSPNASRDEITRCLQRDYETSFPPLRTGRLHLRQADDSRSRV